MFVAQGGHGVLRVARTRHEDATLRDDAAAAPRGRSEDLQTGVSAGYVRRDVTSQKKTWHEMPFDATRLLTSPD